MLRRAEVCAAPNFGRHCEFKRKKNAVGYVNASRMHLYVGMFEIWQGNNIEPQVTVITVWSLLSHDIFNHARVNCAQA